MDSLNKVAFTCQQFEMRAARAAEEANRNPKCGVEGFADTKPKIPVKDPGAEQIEVKKMAELSIKEQSTPSASGQVRLTDDKHSDSTEQEQSALSGDLAGRSEELAANVGQSAKADVSESAEQKGAQPSLESPEESGAGAEAENQNLLAAESIDADNAEAIPSQAGAGVNDGNVVEAEPSEAGVANANNSGAAADDGNVVEVEASEAGVANTDNSGAAGVVADDGNVVEAEPSEAGAANTNNGGAAGAAADDGNVVEAEPIEVGVANTNNGGAARGG